eukprot:SAG11_NODE_1001_length_6220_cov_6.550400_10_plen_54_part_00
MMYGLIDRATLDRARVTLQADVDALVARATNGRGTVDMGENVCALGTDLLERQ